MRTRLRRILVAAVALLTATSALPAAAAEGQSRQHHPSHGGLSATIRYTEYGIPHILAKNYTDKVALKVTDNAVQVMGGHGYIRENPVEGWLRHARGFVTFDGMALV